MAVRAGVLAMAVLFAGCGDSGDTSGADGDSDTDSDTDTDTDTGDGGGGETETTPQELTLHMVDAGGSPLSGVRVNFCNTTGCRTTTTAADGLAYYDNVLLTPYSLEPLPVDGSGLATPYVPLQFATDEVKEFTLVMPPLGAGTVLGASQEVDIDGLLLTVSLAAIEAPPFSDPPTEIAGVRVDPTALPPIALPGTVLGVWYLSPFNYTAPSGLAARFDNTFGLTDGATAHVYVGSYDAFDWVDGGEVTAAGGYLTGASIPLLSTVVLIQD
jgi:hypothetical protein